MKTQFYTASSLDGYIADSRNSLDWLMQFGSTDETSYPEFIAQIGAIAMGSTTYEWLLDNMVEGGPDGRQPWPYEQPVWVFTSRTLRSVDGARIRFVRGDVRPVHAEMVAAAAGKNIWVAGGGDLAGQFHDHGLLDEVIVQFAGVTLGAGAPLFPRRVSLPPMRLISVERFGPFAELRYELPRTE